MTQTQKDKSSHKDKNSGHIHTDPKLILQANCKNDLKIGQPIYFDKELEKYLPAISVRSNVRKSFIQGIVWGFVGDDKFYLRVQPGPMEYRLPLTSDYFSALKPSVIVNNSLIPGDYGSPLWLSESVPGGLSSDPPLTGPKVIVGYKTDYGFIYRPKSITCCSDDVPPESSSSSSSSFPTLIIDNGRSNCYITVQSTNTKPSCKWQRPEIIDIQCSSDPVEIFGWRKDPVNDCIGIQKVKILENCVDDNCGDFLVGPVLDQFLDAMGLPAWVPTNAACACEEKCYITFISIYDPDLCKWPLRATAIEEVCTFGVEDTYDWKKSEENDCVGLKKVRRDVACNGASNNCLDINTFGPGEYDAFFLNEVGEPDWTPTNPLCVCNGNSSSSSSSSSGSGGENPFKVTDRWRAECANSTWTITYMGTWCIDSTTTQFDVWEESVDIFNNITCLRYYYKEIPSVTCSGPEGPINEQEDPPQFTPATPNDIPACCITSSSSSSSSSSSTGPCSINCGQVFNSTFPYLDVTSGSSIATIYNGTDQTISVSYDTCVNDANFGNFVIPYKGSNNNLCGIGSNIRAFVNDVEGKKYSGFLSDSDSNAIVSIQMSDPNTENIEWVCPGNQYGFDTGLLTWGLEMDVPNVTGGQDTITVCGPYNFRAQGYIQNSSNITFDGSFGNIGAAWEGVNCSGTDPNSSTVDLSFNVSTVYLCGTAPAVTTTIGSAELIVDGGSPIPLDVSGGNPMLNDISCTQAALISRSSSVTIKLYTGTDISGHCPTPGYSGTVELDATNEIPIFDCCCCETYTDNGNTEYYTDCSSGVNYIRFGEGVSCGESPGHGYFGACANCDGVWKINNFINTANGTVTIDGTQYPVAADLNKYIIASIPCSAFSVDGTTSYDYSVTIQPATGTDCTAPTLEYVNSGTFSVDQSCDCPLPSGETIGISAYDYENLPAAQQYNQTNAHGKISLGGGPYVQNEIVVTNNTSSSILVVVRVFGSTSCVGGAGLTPPITTVLAPAASVSSCAYTTAAVTNTTIAWSTL